MGCDCGWVMGVGVSSSAWSASMVETWQGGGGRARGQMGETRTRVGIWQAGAGLAHAFQTKLSGGMDGRACMRTSGGLTQ